MIDHSKTCRYCGLPGRAYLCPKHEREQIALVAESLIDDRARIADDQRRSDYEQFQVSIGNMRRAV